MHRPRSSRSSTDSHEVDLAATVRRFRLAREQSASQSSTKHIRSIAGMRWSERDHQIDHGNQH
jgi:hypothetical protein